MKNRQILSIVFTGLMMTFIACSQQHSHDSSDEDTHHHTEEEHLVHLSQSQFAALGLQVDSLSYRNLADVVEVNGQLEVPPQNEASVTAILGANIQSIKVIEGDKVEKGQILAWLNHPNLIELQTDYLDAFNHLSYVQEEYNRQKKLYENEVGAGKEYQKIRSEYMVAQSKVTGLASQLKLLGMQPQRIQEGKLYEITPVISPIEGYIKKIYVKTGQYVQPEFTMMEVVNNHHIHADLMVFEKDVYKVKEGQKVRFKVETLPDEELIAEIYSVGKTFEQKPKAVHVHAEIENKKGYLIPGMYIKGEIITKDQKVLAVPEEAVVREEDSFYIFSADFNEAGDEWHFTPIEIRTGLSNNNWVEVKLLEALSENQLIAINNAYYLMAEMKKGEGESQHSH